MSADGFLDDTSEARAVLSSPEDLDAVLRLRAQSDMIIIGGETLRRDNPSLATRGGEHAARRERNGRAPDPVKVVISRSGDIPADRAFFRDGSAETIVLSATPADVPGTFVRLEGHAIDAVQALAEARGLKDVLVEGGAQVLRLALPRARWFRLAVSPKRLGETGHAHLFDPDAFLAEHAPVYSRQFGDTTAHYIDLHRARARQLMGEAFALAARSPASDSAFAVGAIACDAHMNVLGTGYSRQTGPRDHAEEAMLEQAPAPHTVVCTLEPCLTRASKPTGCAERLVAAGVQRLYYAVAEDGTFTDQCGLAYLSENGVELVRLAGFEAAHRAVNRGIYSG